MIVKKLFIVWSCFFLLISCDKKHVPTVVQKHILSQEQEDNLLKIDKVLSENISGKTYYAIMGPFILEKSTVVSEAFRSEESYFYVVGNGKQELYYAYDTRFLFAQKDLVFFFIFENGELKKLLN